MEINDLPEPMDLPLADSVAPIAKKSAHMPAVKSASGVAPESGLVELMRENIKWSREIYSQNKKIKRRLTVMAVGSYVKLVLIIAPIILAILYLPPLLEKTLGSFNEIFGNAGTDAAGLGGILSNGFNFNLNDIISNLSPEQLEAAQKALPQSQP